MRDLTEHAAIGRRDAVSRTILCLGMLLALWSPASLAISDPDNNGQWNKPAESGPDKEVPGFLVNLGPTGARAILKETSFVVKYVFPKSPAARALKLDDEITGANGKPFSKHTFGKAYGMKSTPGLEGPIMDLGNAIEDSEGAKGVLRLTILRKGKEMETTIQLKPMGRFGATFPVDCRKSKALSASALKYVLASEDFLGGQCHQRATVGLALLAQGRKKEAQQLAYAWNKAPGPDTWTWPVSYQCIFLCEYYLKTKDRKVLNTIKELTNILNKAQVMDPALYKDRVHNGVAVGKSYLKGGFGHVAKIDGYGTMNLPTCLAMLAWELAEDCGVKVDRTHVNLAFECVRASTHPSGYIGYCFAKGSYSPVGRQGLSILTHRMLKPTDEIDAYVKRATAGLVSAKNRLNDGHGDNVVSLFWALVGIQATGDKEAIRSVLDYNKAFINMARTHDGAFVAQPCRNTGDKGYYLSSRLQLTAAMILVLGMDNPQLRLQSGCPDRKQKAAGIRH